MFPREEAPLLFDLGARPTLKDGMALLVGKDVTLEEGEELGADECLDLLEGLQGVPAIAILCYEYGHERVRIVTMSKGRERTHVALISKAVFVHDHGFEHRICDIAQLE